MHVYMHTCTYVRTYIHTCVHTHTYLIMYCVMQDWDKPEYIPDPDATQPEDWDEDMDGEWEPPMIPNPDYNGTPATNSVFGP